MFISIILQSLDAMKPERGSALRKGGAAIGPQIFLPAASTEDRALIGRRVARGLRILFASISDGYTRPAPFAELCNDRNKL
jgi:hypothetical protein